MDDLTIKIRIMSKKEKEVSTLVRYPELIYYKISDDDFKTFYPINAGVRIFDIIARIKHDRGEL